MIIALSKVNPRLMNEKAFKAALRLLIGAGGTTLIPLIKNMHACAIEKINASLINNITQDNILFTP